MLRVFVTFCLAWATLSGQAFVAPPDAEAGKLLAGQYCAQCHVIAPNTGAGWTDAPSFETVANLKGLRFEQLAGFIQRPQAHMLHTDRTPREANEIASYIMSLRARK